MLISTVTRVGVEGSLSGVGVSLLLVCCIVPLFGGVLAGLVSLCGVHARQIRSCVDQCGSPRGSGRVVVDLPFSRESLIDVGNMSRD